MLKVRAFDLGGHKYADRYTIQILWMDNSRKGVFDGIGDEYTMSADANMPNGICSFAGTVYEGKESGRNLGREIQIGDLPKGTLLQVIQLLQDYSR